jgi:hypothetical protein
LFFTKLSKEGFLVIKKGPRVLGHYLGVAQRPGQFTAFGKSADKSGGNEVFAIHLWQPGQAQALSQSDTTRSQS